MDDVDVVLGYPWMDSTGTININVQFFLKLWYKKKKITLQGIYLSPKQGTHMAHEEVFVEEPITVPTDTSNEEFVLESEEDTIKAQ